MTCLAAKAACYIPCVRWSRIRASARSDSGIILWVVGSVFGKGVFGYRFLNSVQLGYCGGILIGQ